MKKNSFQKYFGFAIIVILLLTSSLAFSQVGINTSSPTTTLDVDGALSLRESPRELPLRNGPNSLNFGSTPHSQYRITGPDQAFSIEEITPINAADGQIARLINTTPQQMTIRNAGGGGSSDILCPGGTNLVLSGINSSVALQYSKGLSRWTVVGYASKESSNKYFVKTPQIAGVMDSKDNNTWEDLKDMSLTFIPVSSFVFVSYSVAGDARNLLLQRTTGKFRLVMNGTEILHTETRTSSLNDRDLYHILFPMYMVSVTPGIPVTIKIQWARDGNGTLYNNPFYVEHERYLVVLD